MAPLELAAAGVTLGADYPHPIVDHAQARTRALAAYAAVGDDKAKAAWARRWPAGLTGQEAAASIDACCTARRLIERGG